MMMHMAQSLQAQPFQQPIQQNQQAQREDRRSSYVNGGTHQRREQSPQGSVLASTRRNEATSGQKIAASQQTCVNLMTIRSQRMGVEGWSCMFPFAKVTQE